MIGSKDEPSWLLQSVDLTEDLIPKHLELKKEFLLEKETIIRSFVQPKVAKIIDDGKKKILKIVKFSGFDYFLGESRITTVLFIHLSSLERGSISLEVVSSVFKILHKQLTQYEGLVRLVLKIDLFDR